LAPLVRRPAPNGNAKTARRRRAARTA